MPKSAYRLEQERKALETFQDKGQLTIQDLADLHDVNYYTARELINDLFQSKKLHVVGQKQRTKIYGLAHNEESDTIPYLSNLLTRTQQKVVGLLAYVSNEDKMQAVSSVKYLPELITKIMSIANQAEHGFPVGKDLEALRKQAQEHYLIIKNTANLYEQILEDARFWTPKYLKDFVNDPAYNYPDIVKAKEYYDAS